MHDKKRILIAFVLSFTTCSVFAMDKVTISNIRPASEKTISLVQKAAQEMGIPFPVSVQAATIVNAKGAHYDHAPDIVIDEDILLKQGEDSLIYTCYHELGHVKDDSRLTTKIIDSVAPYSMYLCLPVLGGGLSMIKSLRTYHAAPVALAAAIGGCYVISKFLRKKARERKEIAADFYACKALLAQNNIFPVAYKLVQTKYCVLIKSGPGLNHNDAAECMNIEAILKKHGYAVSYDTTNAFTQEPIKSLTVSLNKDALSSSVKMRWW